MDYTVVNNTGTGDIVIDIDTVDHLPLGELISCQYISIMLYGPSDHGQYRSFDFSPFGYVR